MKWMAVVVLLAVAVSPASASFLCTLSGTPALVAAGGLAEPAGDVVLQCAGPPGQTVRMTLSVIVDRRIANPVDPASGDPGGIRLWLDSASTPAPLPNLPRLFGNSVVFEGVTVASNAGGQLTLRVAGLRVEAAERVTASISVVADAPFFLPSNQTVIARSAPGLYATVLPGALCCAGPPVPDTLDWPSVLARKPWPVVVRVTEGFSSAFQPAASPGPPEHATRLLIHLSGLPSGSRVLVPQAIVGGRAAQPTRSGAFGTAPDPGVYNPAPKPLLLGLVPQADPKGAGGLPVPPPAAAVPLNEVREVLVEGEQAWVAYQVMEADPGAVEMAEIPVWVFTPTTRTNKTVIARAEVRLAPLSEAVGAIRGAPIPRYTDVVPPPDCPWQGDCNADYFPRLFVVPSETTEFVLQSGGGLKDGYIFVMNDGGWFIEWDAFLRDPADANWLLLRGTAGYAEGSYHYQLNPKELPPGEYSAEIVFRQKNSPTGENAEFVIPIRLTVTEGPPPAPPKPPAPPSVPAPVLWAAMTVPFGFEGPFASGGWLKLQGNFFSGETAVSVGGIPADVLSVQPGELLVRIPESLGRGMQPVVASNGAQSSQPLFISVLPVAPSIVAVKNAGGQANGETAPAAPGVEALLEVTGIALADEPVWVNVHDRWQPAGKQAAPLPGLHVLRIVIPEDLPEMMTAVRVCVSGPGVDSICSHPVPIWLGSK
ncbi:MAG: hypothetical protein WHT08_03395 [Bryobacteraceae bacterium]